MVDYCLPASSIIIPLGENKVRKGRCNLSPSVEASLLCTFAFKCATSLHIELSACILETTEHFAQSCRGGLRGPAACINIWVTPTSQYNHLLCSLWDSHLSPWEKELRILTAFTCLNKNLHLGASP